MTTHDTTSPTPQDTAAGVERAPVRGPRMRWPQLAPDVYKAMVQLDTASRQGVDPVLLELVRIRTSQLNHCASCIDMHTKDALAAGESVQRIMQLSAWKEAQHFYTERELAALELTESITVLTDDFVPDEVYEWAAMHFDETELVQLIAAITAMNAWNRFNVAARTVAGRYQPGDHS
ncbi:carboxymuconolactone decarboxylase family protein [Streptomyces odontomachi]|uniref:carboxymuconolactone decarboxylase family protein n=1 Tax=Streptomyces odontomachi TaxID=2944940 RepID=UPI00210B2B94|nr:carboxymuconolactone decarboxylase family protein [Streptomyces sp. ODS25]